MPAIPWTPQTANQTAAFRIAQCPRCGFKWQDTNATATQPCTNCGGAMAGANLAFIPSP